MQIALGTDEEKEYKKNLSLLSECLVGESGLLFTNRKESEILKYFKNYKEKDFAKSGFIATETIELEEGPLEQFPHSMEPMLRTQLYLPTSLQKGVINLIKPHTVCKKGEALTPEQGKLLKLLGVKMSEFFVNVVCVWRSSDEKFKKI
eukprot:TRINITY_DN7789_c0_g1_i2.p1 TRINITY_DN7789_c0_g1~~TRINITY_DN7789_c0_g1_i2.p1  ORF type:complete len:148 (+),score=50.42 TRINITY_DN7789_c0_g1_i2:278-721(+)